MKIINIFSLLILIGSGAWAQENRDISLKIVDKKGLPLTNIIVQSSSTGMTGITDNSGLFVFGDMPDSAVISMMLPKYGEATVPVAGMDSIIITLRSATRYSYLNNKGKNVLVNKNKNSSSSVFDVQELVKQYGYRSMVELLVVL